jgi:hypothetical protein
VRCLYTRVHSHLPLGSLVGSVRNVTLGNKASEDIRELQSVCPLVVSEVLAFDRT